MKDIKIDPNKKDLIKRFSILTAEREQLERIQSVMGILNIQRDGLQLMVIRELAKIRTRLNINEKDAPDGYERFVDIDPDKWEMLVIDRPILKQPEDAAKVENMAKN